MKINDKYSLKQEAMNIYVIERYETKITEKNTSGFGEKKHAYGTVYQALQGLVSIHLANQLSDKPVLESIKDIMADIYNAEELIKKTFRTEVLVVR